MVLKKGNSSMRFKRKGKQLVSGMLAALTVLSTVVSPISAYAAEPDVKPPLYEEIKDMLDADEVVVAHDW